MTLSDTVVMLRDRIESTKTEYVWATPAEWASVKQHLDDPHLVKLCQGAWKRDPGRNVFFVPMYPDEARRLLQELGAKLAQVTAQYLITGKP